MPRFASAALALEWAETVLAILEGGRSNGAMMEQLGGGGLSKSYAILDAIEIRHASREACRSGWPCPYLRDKCLFHWHLPDPCIEYPPMSYSQECRVKDCAGTFEARLRAKNYLER